MGRDQFSDLLRNAQRRTVQNGVKPGQGGRRTKVDFVKEEDGALSHGKGQRAVLKDHSAVPYGEMPHKIREFQAFVAGGVQNGILEGAASCRTSEVLPQPVGPYTYSGSGLSMRNQTITSRLDSWKA